jgi:alpha-beta hydrolase superfamily lysophospholipase
MPDFEFLRPFAGLWLLFFCGCSVMTSSALAQSGAPHEAQYRADVLEGFERLDITQPEEDYAGEVITTLVRRRASDSQGTAVLYVHGFNDYFFQTEMAERFNEAGHDFYAVDMRKYGRSWRPHQRMTNVRDLSEYYADIDTALALMKAEGAEQILLSGHSTGGLITTLYAHDRSQQGKLQIDALHLNSPFYDFNSGFLMRRIAIPLLTWWNRDNPDKIIEEEEDGEPSNYARSLYEPSGDGGEWNFNTDWKAPDRPITYGWLRAIYQGHERVRSGLEIPVPVMVMHSDKTIREEEWSEAFFTGDAVLDVEDIKEGAGQIQSPDLRLVEIENAMHDVILSRGPVRDEAYTRLFEWLDEVL